MTYADNPSSVAAGAPATAASRVRQIASASYPSLVTRGAWASGASATAMESEFVAGGDHFRMSKLSGSRLWRREYPP